MNRKIKIQITEQPILLGHSTENEGGSWLQGSLAHGAEVVFIGRIRNYNQGKTVKAVSYDVFIPLAQKTLQTLCEEAQDRWGKDLEIQIIHRTGKVELGGISVMIRVTSTHRDESYQASRYLIEEIKHRVPIWKKEHYTEGESAWLEGHALCS